jgi:hypothetical protein
MAGDYDSDVLSYIDISSSSVEVVSVTTTTLPNKDIVYIYRTSDGNTAKIVAHNGNPPPRINPPVVNRFQQIILELEEQHARSNIRSERT